MAIITAIASGPNEEKRIPKASSDPSSTLINEINAYVTRSINGILRHGLDAAITQCLLKRSKLI